MGSMNTLLLVVFITTLAGSVTLAATERKQKKADIQSDLLATLQSDLKEDLTETKRCPEQEGLSWNENLDAEPLDLDRTPHALLVQGIGRCLAGNANSPIFLYIRAGNSWRKLLYKHRPIIADLRESISTMSRCKRAQTQIRCQAWLA